MKKLIIISDSFKGSLDSKTIANIFSSSVKKVFNDSIKVESFLVGDGGEGTLDVISQYINGIYKKVSTFDSNLNKIEASYLSKDDTSFIEVSSCVSLPLTKIKDPLITSSYGVGLLILDAIKSGSKKIYLCLGGSSTNDFGLGLVSALGGKFYDKLGKEFVPKGGFINQIESFDLTQLYKNIDGVEIIGLVDVDNPLVGENGCSLIFGPQKGCDLKQAKFMDESIIKFTSKLHEQNFKNINNIKGAGAAGGIGGAILQFLNGSLVKGIDYVLSLIKFEQHLDSETIVFTGEGKLDDQSSKGKVVDGVSLICEKHSIPCIAIVGGDDISKDSPLYRRLTAVFTTTRLPKPFDEIKKEAKKYYEETLLSILNTIKIFLK